MKPISHPLLNTLVHAFTLQELNQLIVDSIEGNKKCHIVSQNLHSLYLASSGNSWILKAQSRALVRIDGMPVIWLAKLFGAPYSQKNRITWLDWYPSLFTLAENNAWKISWMGASEQQHLEASVRLKSEFPKLKIEFIDGYEQKYNQQINKINATQCEILLVGLGMPLQEEWIIRHHQSVSTPVILSCGGLIDYFVTGGKVPPRWMGSLGLEWAYRLTNNPKRLWKRYLIEPFLLLPKILTSLVNHYFMGK